MNSLLTFCGQVLLSKAIAFFILRNLGNVCQRRFFLLYSYLSIADFHGVFLMCHISALGCM